ncbi:MAG: phosphohydrolase, partial [Lacinutrix venerupis]
MKDLVNKFYKNHALVYKVLLFIVTTFLIVYLFPKSGKFKYDFEKGKPWQSETLYAPFDFAIQKTPKELEEEKIQIETTTIKYFNLDPDIKGNVLNKYYKSFDKVFPDSIYTSKNEIKNFGKDLIEKLYEYGVTNEDELIANKSTVTILKDRVEVGKTDFSNIYRQSQVKPKIDEEIKKNNFEEYSKPLSILFFNIIEPNLTYNKALSDTALQERLSSISHTRGSIEKETLIISKGEIVEGNKFLILSSLESEYESQVWNESNYNLILFAYTLLVALALLMLLLFLRKYRLEVFNNNTKVTFIFFNIFLMVLLTTLIVNYDSKYIYIVPLAILPLVLKAFFDARLGLFTHVITVLLLGFIVPNSYEYMFLQILAGIVTILTVSELYKRANLFISVGQITLVYI